MSTTAVIKTRKGSNKSNTSRMANKKSTDNFNTQPSYDGVYKNPKLVHTLLSAMGKTCEAQVRNGSKYNGVFHTFNPQVDVNISMAHMMVASGSGDPLGDVIPRAEDLIDELIIPSEKLVVIKIPNVDLSFAETDSTQANGDASLSRNNSQAKELQMWEGGSGDEGGLELEDDSLKSGSNGWHAEEMFTVNEKKFGVRSTNFKESEDKYTMKIDYNEHDAERIKWASQIANDIESSDKYKQRVELELDDGITEEDKFSAVKRENSREQMKSSPTDARANKEATDKRDIRSRDMRDNRDQRNNDHRRNHDMRPNDKEVISPQGNRHIDRFPNKGSSNQAWGKHNRYNNQNSRSIPNSMSNNRTTMQNAESPTSQGSGMKHSKPSEKPPRFAKNNYHDDRHSQNDNMMHQSKPSRQDRHNVPSRRLSGGGTQPRAWGQLPPAHQANATNPQSPNQQPQEYHSPQGGVHNGKMVQQGYKPQMSPQQQNNPPLPSQVGNMPPQQPMHAKGKPVDHRYPATGRNTQVPPTAAVAAAVSTKPLTSATVAQSMYPTNDPGVKWSQIAATGKQHTQPQTRTVQVGPMPIGMPTNGGSIRPHIITGKQESFIYQVGDNDGYPAPQPAGMNPQYQQQMGIPQRVVMHPQASPMQAPNPMQQAPPLQQPTAVPHSSPAQVSMPQQHMSVQGQAQMMPQGTVVPPQQQMPPGTQAPPMPQRQGPPQGRQMLPPQQQPAYPAHTVTNPPLMNHQVQQTQVTSKITSQKPQPKPQPASKPLEQKVVTKTESSGSSKKGEGTNTQLQQLRDFGKNFKLSSGEKETKKDPSTPDHSSSTGVAKNSPTSKPAETFESPKTQKTENVTNVQRIPVVNDAQRPVKEDTPTVQSPTQQPQVDNIVPTLVAPVDTSTSEKTTSSPVEANPPMAAADAQHKELNPDAKEFKPTFRTTPSEPATPTPGQAPQMPQVYQVPAVHSYLHSPNYQTNQKRYVTGISQPGMMIDQAQAIHPNQIQTNPQFYQHNMYVVQQPQNSPSHQLQHQMQPQSQMQQMQGYTAQFEQSNTYINRTAGTHPGMMTQPRMGQPSPHAVSHYHPEQAPPPQVPVYVSTSQTMQGQYPNPQMQMGRPNSANSAVHAPAASPAQQQQPQNSVTPTQQPMTAPAVFYPPNNQQFTHVMPPAGFVVPQHPGAQFVPRPY